METCAGCGALGLGPAVRTRNPVDPEPFMAPAWWCHVDGRGPRQAAAERGGPAADTYGTRAGTRRAGRKVGKPAVNHDGCPKGSVEKTLDSGWQSQGTE